MAFPSLPSFYWFFLAMVLALAVNLLCLRRTARGKDRAVFWLAVCGMLVTLFLGIALSVAGSLAGISRLRLFPRTGN